MKKKANHNWQTCDCCKRKFLADYKMNKINKKLLCEIVIIIFIKYNYLYIIGDKNYGFTNFCL